MCSCFWCASYNTFQWLLSCLHDSICTPKLRILYPNKGYTQKFSGSLALAEYLCAPPLNMRCHSWLNNQSGKSQGIWCWLESGHPVDSGVIFTKSVVKVPLDARNSVPASSWSPVNVKHDARCVMGNIGGRQKNPKGGGILIYCYKSAVIG